MDWRIRFGDIVVLLGMFGSVGVYVFKSGRLPEIIKSMREDIKELKDEQKAQGIVIQAIAVQNVRLDNQASRLNDMDRKLESLRRLEGLIVTSQAIQK